MITMSSSYEPARATAGHVPGAAPVRPWAMFTATVVAMSSQDDSHIPARRWFASKRGRVTSQGAASAGLRAVSAGMTRALSRGCLQGCPRACTDRLAEAATLIYLPGYSRDGSSGLAGGSQSADRGMPGGSAS